MALITLRRGFESRPRNSVMLHYDAKLVELVYTGVSKASEVTYAGSNPAFRILCGVG